MHHLMRTAVVCLGLTSCLAASPESEPEASDEIASSVDACRPDGSETLFGICVPAGAVAAPDTSSVTLGVRFTPTVSGEIRGVRMYRPGAGFPAGGFPVALWSATGTKLSGGTATIGQNPSQGWISGPLNTAVRVTAGQTYVATYQAPAGGYAYQHQGLASDFVAPKLRALAGGGTYAYGAAETFPTSSFLNSNYFVDVVFVPDACPATPSPTIFGGCAPAGTSVATQDVQAVNLGVRFRATTNGTVNAVRFFRSTTFPAGGFQVGVWNDQGVLLSSGTATIGQNPSTGWFTGVLNSSVAIQAGQTYTAGYLAPAGQYNYLSQGLASAIQTPSLTALAGGGVYAYGSSLARPTSSFNNTNYFVDVSFVPAP